jgi:thiosulfate/3-mercaptopyruvate sulfurtransferase
MKDEDDAREDVLVGTKWLEEHLHDPGLRVVEVDVSPKAYGEGHIPGAVLWNIYSDLKDGDYRLVDRAAIERLVERSGIVQDSVVVFYGYGPAMGFWLMKLFGHTDARILNAGRATWQREGRPWSADVEQPRETRYPLPEEDDRIRAAQPQVENAIGDPGRIIVDVRTEAEYRGERFWPSGGLEEGGHTGHIPSAAHVLADGLLDGEGAFTSAAELRGLYSRLELADDSEVIPYCTIGGRACTTWFVLTYLLGHERTRVYDGSWAEWGRMPATPVERAVFGERLWSLVPSVRSDGTGGTEDRR